MEPDRVTPDVEELLPDYLADAQECLEKVSQVLLAVDRGEQTPEFVPELFRQMHIIKGGAGLMGFATLEALSHAAEDVLGLVKKDALSFTPALASALLEAHDGLRALMSELEDGGITCTDPQPTIALLERVLAGEEVAGDGEAAVEPAPVAATSVDAGQAAMSAMSDEENDEVVQEFFVESWELIDELDQDLVTLEETPDDADLLNKIFRAAHTLKGSSSFLGFTAISGVTHRVEDIFNKLRKHEMTLAPEVMDVILEAVDRVRKLMEAAQDGSDGPLVEDILAALGEVSEGGKPRRLGEILVQDEGVPEAVVEQALKEDSGGKPLGEVLVEKAAVSSDVVQRSLAKQARQRPVQAEQNIRVDVSRLDALMNLVGELVLGKNRLARLRSQMEERWEGEELVEALGETSAQIDLVASDLQLAVMKTRLVPIGKVFRKFPRMVRDLARSLHKEMRLETGGEGTEMDKSVVEVIGDPLVHLIRNSADHGIESPEDRVAQGKPREGRIRLSARHEGNHIVVSIEDDGKGMDPEKLKQKAVEKGLISAQEATAMTKSEALNLIFAPGFSMAKQVTNVSGRGVGMDVVKTNIQQVNGLIEIDSELGVGTRVDVRIPLTLAIIQALLVRSANEIYAVPLVSVVETVRIDADDVKTVDQYPVLRLRDQVLPLLRVDDVFRGVGRHATPTTVVTDPDDGAAAEREYVVVIGVAEKRVGLVVQELVGEEEVVIKSLGGYLSDTPGIAGATIRGDGRVTLIVDVSQILEIAAKARAEGIREVA